MTLTVNKHKLIYHLLYSLRHIFSFINTVGGMRGSIRGNKCIFFFYNLKHKTETKQLRILDKMKRISDNIQDKKYIKKSEIFI